MTITITGEQLKSMMEGKSVPKDVQKAVEKAVKPKYEPKCLEDGTYTLEDLEKWFAFFCTALEKLTEGKYKGKSLLPVSSGYNNAFEKFFGVDPVLASNTMIKHNLIRSKGWRSKNGASGVTLFKYDPEAEKKYAERSNAKRGEDALKKMGMAS